MKSSLVGKSGGAAISSSENNIFNQKQELLKQFDPHIEEQISNHTWNVISYNPLKFILQIVNKNKLLFLQ